MATEAVNSITAPNELDELNSRNGETAACFELLRDFWFTITALELNGVDPELLDRRFIDDAVRIPMLRAFEVADYTVSTWEVDQLRKRTASEITVEEFCATFDRKVYFANADFQLDLTRTVSDLKRTGSQYFTRRPRQGKHTLDQQLQDLKGALIQSKATRLVLADDGLSTGQMMKIVIEACRAKKISVDRVVVCCNNIPDKSNIDGVPITSIVTSRPGVPWLNERDLYWGLPRSGLSFAPGGSRTYGVPFTAKVELVQQRIGIEDQVREFRAACLGANVALWKHFEKIAGRALYCEDCPPLTFVPEVLHRSNVRVLDLLADLLQGHDLDFELV